MEIVLTLADPASDNDLPEPWFPPVCTASKRGLGWWGEAYRDTVLKMHSAATGTELASQNGNYFP